MQSLVLACWNSSGYDVQVAYSGETMTPYDLIAVHQSINLSIYQPMGGILNQSRILNNLADLEKNIN